MFRNLKVLGLGLIAVLALSAMAAQGAIASPDEDAQLTVEGGGEVTITGEQGEEQTFVRGGLSVSCEVAEFHGQESNGDTTITLEPTYEKCKTSLGGPATVTVTGCDYVFHLFAEPGSPEDTWGATADLNCGHTGHIVIHAYISTNQHNNTPAEPTCQYTLSDTDTGPTQPTTNQGLTGVDLTNKPADPSTPKNWIEADLNIHGIHSVRTRGSALICGAATHSTGGLTGTAILKGDDPGTGEPKGATISTHDPA